VVKEVMDSPAPRPSSLEVGLWPEPYQFDPQQERRSFFWGRDAAGALQYFDGYNAPAGAGYHHEEWYVPARYVPPAAPSGRSPHGSLFVSTNGDRHGTDAARGSLLWCHHHRPEVGRSA